MTLNTGARTTRPTAGAVDVEDVRRRHPIEEVVAASGVELHRTGRGWMGCCPFHDDSTASLSVAGVPDRFHCFGCGASGDVIDYIGRLHGVGFREAVAVLDNTAEARMPPSPAPHVPTVSHGARSQVIADVDPGRGYEINSLAWQWFSRPVAHTFAVSYLRHHRRIDLRAAELELGQALVGHTGHGWTDPGRPPPRPRRHRRRARRDGPGADLASGTAHRHPPRPAHHPRHPPGRPDHRVRRPRHQRPPPSTEVPQPHPHRRPSTRASASTDRRTGPSPMRPSSSSKAPSTPSPSPPQPQCPRFIEQVAPCATLGATATPAQVQQVAGLSTEPVVIALDGDQAGADGTLRWVDALCRQAGQLALVSRLPDGLDPADWLARHGPDGLVAFHPAQRHTTRDATSDAQVQAASPHLPGRELAALACAGSDPVGTLLSDLQRLAPLLNRGALGDLANGAVAEMTRQGWNRGDAFTRELSRALGRDSRPPPRARDHTSPIPSRMPDLR